MQPSLPRRLRFNRQHSDLTPKGKSGSNVVTVLFQEKDKKDKDKEKGKDKEALNATKQELTKKNEEAIEYRQQIEELKEEIHQLNTALNEKIELIKVKDEKVSELETQIAEYEGIHQSLKSVSEQLQEKINTLEGEIKTILRNHENEMECLIRKNTTLTDECQKLLDANKLSNETQTTMKTDITELQIKIDFYKTSLDAEAKKMEEKDNEYRKLLDENVQLLNGIEQTKKQADDDMLCYAMESQKLITDLETTKREMSKIITELCLKQELVNALQEELAGKNVEMDAERDELRDSWKAEFDLVMKKHEHEIGQLKAESETKYNEIASMAALEKAKLQAEYIEQMEHLKETVRKEKDQINESAEEKIRISEIQAEQKIKSLETMIEQSIQREKDLWKLEINKCQKIAESEIMQSEFEKQDLKTLLQSANELMLEKDEKIAELQNQLKQEITNFVQAREVFENELKEKQQECSHLIKELYQYQLTLQNTRSTVTILMERLRKSDHDVDILKAQLDSVIEAKKLGDVTNARLTNELKTLALELEEYRLTLNALRSSSLALEREMLDKDSVFEKIMSSEEETLETVNKIGKLFHDKLEENINKYAELYNDIKKKYDARETYIRDMKALLEEFATGIELARLELDMKDKQLAELQEENKNIKLEIMTIKFKCEQFEKYDQEQRVPNPSPDLSEEVEHDKFSMLPDEAMVSNQLIENIIVQLEKEVKNDNFKEVLNSELFSDEDKIAAENSQLKEKLSEKMRQIEFLQEMVEMETGHATENSELRRKVDFLHNKISFDFSLSTLHFFQINELEQKVELIEKFANDSVEKPLKEKQTKNVSQLHSIHRQRNKNQIFSSHFILEIR